jgi:aminopeptidase
MELTSFIDNSIYPCPGRTGDKLADVLINYSTELEEGEKILIEAIDIPPEMVISLIRSVDKVGGIPLVTLKSNAVFRDLFRHATEEQMKLIGDIEKYRMEKMDAYIGLRGSYNISETSDVPSERMKLYQGHWLKPVHLEVRVPKTKWVVLRWPTPSMAQQAGMSTEQFEKFYFDVCTLDYSKMDKAFKPMQELMDRTDKVRILGPQDTDIEFSIKDIPSVPCAGKLNIPDGEIFTAPVKDSVNGVIHYNTPTLYQGVTHENVRLEFRDGKVIDATGSDTERLNEILDSDEGARYIGEFAMGVNPFIDNAMKDILFDEKIKGSLHFTPGNAYDEADNGNKSQVHWDMVLIQTPEYGGGEIWFDDVLIRKDGMFVLDELKVLNPENLV